MATRAAIADASVQVSIAVAGVITGSGRATVTRTASREQSMPQTKRKIIKVA
jgi:hypothetical protein